MPMHAGGEGIPEINRRVDPTEGSNNLIGQLGNEGIQPDYEVEGSGGAGPERVHPLKRGDTYIPPQPPNFIQPQPNPVPPFPPSPNIQETDNPQIRELEQLAEEIPPIVLQDESYGSDFGQAIVGLSVSGDGVAFQRVLEVGTDYFQIDEPDFRIIQNSRQNYNDLRLRAAQLRSELTPDEWSIVSRLLVQQRNVVQAREARWESSVELFESQILQSRFGAINSMQEGRARLSNEEAMILANFFEENHSPRSAQQLYNVVVARDTAEPTLAVEATMAALRIDIRSSNDPVRIRNAVSELRVLRQTIAQELRNSNSDEMHLFNAESWGLIYEGISFLRYARDISSSEIEMYDNRLIELENEYDAMIQARQGHVNREEAEFFMQNMRHIATVYCLRDGRIEASFRPEAFLDYILQAFGQDTRGLSSANEIYQNLISRLNQTSRLIASHIEPSAGDTIFEDYSNVLYMTFVEAPRRANLPNVAISNLRYIKNQEGARLLGSRGGMFNASSLADLLCCPPHNRLDITISDSFHANMENFRNENPHLFSNQTDQEEESPLAINIAHPANAQIPTISSLFGFLNFS